MFKKIQFNNKTYQIPTSWDSVNLEMQIKVSEIAALQKYVKMIAIISAYTGIPIEDLKHAKINKVTKVMEHLDFIYDELPTEPLLDFEFKGEHYYIAQNIIEQEFQDYISIQTKLAEYKDNIWKASPYILAVMAKKKGETLDDYNVENRTELFLQLPITIVNRITAFFLSSQNGLQLLTTLSSQEGMGRLLNEKMIELNNSITKLKKQHGGNLLIHLLIMILRKWIKYLKKELEKYSNSPQSKSSKKKWKQTFKK